MDKYTILLDFIIENEKYIKYTSTILRDFMKSNFDNINSIDKLKSEYNRIIIYFEKNYENVKKLEKEKIKRRIFTVLMIALGAEKYIDPVLKFKFGKNIILDEIYSHYLK